MLMLYASGNKDDTTGSTQYTIADAEALIEQQNYDGATSLLVEIVRNDPEQMERAQKLIMEIRTYRDLYNLKYEQLMKVLFVQEDYEASLVLIKELESLDPNPNQATQGSLRDARISAEFVYNRNVFNQIMDQALVFLDEEKYLQALKLYSTGFTLSRRTFDETNYDLLIKEPVNRTMNGLNSTVATLDDTWGGLEASVSLLLNNDNADPFENALTQFRELLDLRNQIYGYAEIISRQNELITLSSESGQEDFFLSFQDRLIMGRESIDNPEGLLTAMDLYINQNLNSISDFYLASMNKAALDGQSLYLDEQWEQSIEQYDRRLELASRLNPFLEENNKRINYKEDETLEKHSKRVYDLFAPLSIISAYSIVESEAYKELVNYRSSFSNYDRQWETNQLQDLWESRRAIRAILPDLDQLREEVDLALNEVADSSFSEKIRLSDRIPFVDLNQGLVQDIRLLDSDILASLSIENLNPLTELASEYTQRLEMDKTYIEGFDQQFDQQLLRIKYPQRALDDLDLLAIQLESLAGDLDSYVDLFQDEVQDLINPQEVETHIQKAINLRNTIGDNLAQLEDLNTQGEQFVNLASRNLNQGNLRFNTAEAELGRYNFDRAKTELTQAQDLFIVALSYNEDIVSRDDLDNRISDLQSRIVDEENKQVIRDVRRLINQATSDYFQGLYLRSETTLNQAENRWYTTNIEENSEIRYWLNLVRAALSVESGRTLEATNPLFQDITKLFNNAYHYFNLGKTALDKGDRVGAIDNLKKADQYLNQILIPLPTNQDARVLKLRIQQLSDPTIFGETFRQMFINAQSKIQRGVELDVAYLDLKDLYSIEPNYRGLANLILETEYLLGIKVRPPNPADLRESRNLYNKALAIYESNDVLFFQSGLELLDSAIELNPRNTDAINLKDLMAVYATGQATFVMSSADQKLFQDAETKFVNQEFFEAYRIVQQLLENPGNRNYVPLQELKRRIESNI